MTNLTREGNVMLLAPREAELFFKLHRSLMCFVNERLEIVPCIDDPVMFSGLPLEARAEVRDALLDEPRLIEEFAAANPYDLSAEELEIVLSWRAYVAGKFFIFRYLKNYAVFLADQPPLAYGVVALTEPFEEVVGPLLPMFVETVLLPFRGKIIYDGLITGYSVSFGPGVRRSLNETYREAKERMGGVVTSLPAEARSALAKKSTKKKAKRKSSRASSAAAQEALVGKDCGPNGPILPQIFK